MKSKARQRTGNQEIPFPIVVAGASAGGLAPFERFLSVLPGKFAFALVFMQHLSPEYKNLLPGLLRSRAGRFDIQEVSEGLRVLAGKVYLCPPASDVRCEKGVFRVVSRPRQHVHLPIDELLVSLSEDAPERAIAVIFSGSGTDGARGAQAVKTQGGTVFVQDPEGAEYPDMPLSAINTVQVDAVLSPEDLAREILKFQRWGRPAVSDDSFMTPVQFDALCQAVNDRTGGHFSHYKSSVVARRVRRRMYLNGIDAVDDYLRLLGRKEQEAADLASDILIGVTSFFRDRLAWKALHLEATRKLVVEDDKTPIRVWAAACATGEEAYSIAMMLQRELDAAGRKREFQVFATDVSEQAMQRAREATYPASISADLPPEYLQRYFSSSAEGLSVTVNKEIRQRVIFAKHDLLADPPFSRLDLIICRNLLIYLDADAQEKCISVFHYALKRGGFLFLGNAESPGRTVGLFATLAHKKCRIYQKAESKQTARMPLSMPFASERPQSRPKPEQDNRQSTVRLVQEALLERYAPAAVAVNQNHDIVYHNGPTNRFLRQPRGAPTQNLLELLPERLKNRIRGALCRTAQVALPVSIRTSIALDDRKKPVVIRVSRVRENLFLVAFKEKGSPVEEAEAPVDETAIEEKVVYQLEHELEATRDNLQSHIEELKSVNEELESSNEELQAANEELETSREELQSLNEELTTVNAQLQSKIEEQEETNNDLNNFLTSTNIPTIFLDPRFRVKRFTPAMSKLIALIPADVGRSIMDMSRENLGGELIDDARSVLDTLTAVRRELSIGEVSYVRTILPYRTGDNRIEGVVVAYVDITERVRAEEELRRSEVRYRELVQNANSAIVRWKVDGAITFFNEYAEAFFGYRAADVLGKNVGLLVPEKESTGADLTTLIHDIVSNPERHANDVNENVCRDGRRVWMAWTNRPIFDENGQISEILAVGSDITELKRAETRIRRLASFPEINPNPIIELDASGAVTFCNPATRTALERAGLDGKDVGALLPPDMDALLRDWDRRTDVMANRQATIGGRVFDEEVHLIPGFNVARIYGRDITSRKQAETALQESEERFRSLFKNLLDAYCYCRMVFAEDGRPVDFVYLEANDAFEVMSGHKNVVGKKVTEVMPGVAEAHPEMFEAYGRVAKTGRSERFEMHFTPADRWCTVQAYSVRKGYVAIISENITERKRHENRVAALTRLYAVLSRVNETIVRVRDERSLFAEVCGAVAELGGFPLVWIGLVQGEQVVPVASCGPESDYLKDIRVEVAGELGRGPTGMCVRENRSVINDDFATNPSTSPWRAQALSHGFHASASFPVRREGKAVGAFTLYAFEPEAFDAEQVSLLDALSADISYALDAMELEGRRVQAEEALRQAHDELEKRVEERTAELRQAYDEIVKEGRERRQLEEQLRQAQKMEALGTLTGGIAHDFNNILSAIIGFTEIVRDRMPKEGREKHHLERVLEAGLRGRELIKRMLAFSRKTEQERKPILLSAVVRETMEFIRSSTPSTISIRVGVKSESGMVFADPVQMQQVVLNLCTNAAQAMQEKGGILDLELSDWTAGESNAKPHGIKPGPYIRLVVRDTGTGISPGIIDRVFDPFFTTKKVGEGTGLGLSVVHGIVHQHGGCIMAESEEGKGSTFTVCLPMVAAEPNGDAAVGQTAPMGDESILFVDDEELLAEMGQEILEDLGYRVTVRTNSLEALELFRSDPGRFDLIITDVTMPEITGVELARGILKIRSDVPIIMCTGFSHLTDAETATAAGIRAFVAKPLTKREIARTIRTVLDG